MYQKLFTLQEDVFKVLANQKRLEIVQLLTDRELSVSQMVSMLGLSQSNLSQHLSLLRHAKVITARRDGQTIYYHLSDQRVARACTMIKQMLKDIYNLSAEDELLYPIAKDVVCGMRISVSQAGDTSAYNNKQYYFCASGCKETFQANPQNYIKVGVLHG